MKKTEKREVRSKANMMVKRGQTTRCEKRGEEHHRKDKGERTTNVEEPEQTVEGTTNKINETVHNNTKY